MGEKRFGRATKTMNRVHIICEGQTEETFVNEVLTPHLEAFQVFPRASLVGKPGHKGGCVTTARMSYDIKLRLQNDRTAWCTTFFDFYGLDSDFVGKSEALSKYDFDEKAQIIEMALKLHVQNEVGENMIRRFLPYIQMYEFEGLLFSDPKKLAAGLYEEALECDFVSIKNSFNSPEEINNNRLTAPSKRILSLMPSYDKPLYGSLAAIEIGLDSMRRECKRFDRWLTFLENLNEVCLVES